MYKKGIELSINFIVIFILAITVFGFGLRFAYMLLGGAEDLTKMAEDELDDRIEDIMCPGDERVCLGTRTRTLRKGNHAVFGVRVLNVLNVEGEVDFTVTAELEGVILKGEYTITAYGVGAGGDPLVVLPDTLLTTGRTDSLENNEEKKFGILVDVPRGASAGKHVITVTVTCAHAACTEDYGKNKIYVVVP
ncbi:hypothetical protein KY360_00175 [Candidatus Woesearchaeota archaeon]|nr:hypothetical protein [Candidatus Woesearchaeota archaeon]